MKIKEILKNKAKDEIIKRLEKLENKVEDLQADNLKLKIENRKLKEEIEQLKGLKKVVEIPTEKVMYKTEMYITTGKQSTSRSSEDYYIIIVTEKENYEKTREIKTMKLKEILGIPASHVVLSINRGQEEDGTTEAKKPYIETRDFKKQEFETDSDLWEFLGV